MKAARVHTSGIERPIVYEEIPEPAAGPGEALIRMDVIGVNFGDTIPLGHAYRGPFPVTLGNEGAGTVVAVGPEVQEVQSGQRVAFMSRGSSGAYAELVVVPAWHLVPLPANMPARDAAATLAQGRTAHYLAISAAPLERGMTCLIHAAAGGVGLLLVQIAKRRGARVIGTVSTREKAKLAREAGADEVILYTETNFAEEVKRLTEGHGVDVVYDGVGETTFLKGLECLRERGIIVVYGAASGPAPAVSPALLTQKGSLYLTGTTSRDYTATREELLERSNELLGWVADGMLNLHIHAEYPLQEAATALDAIQNRSTAGKLLLIP
jgi:NADPH2:quinone reductase